MSTSFAQAVWPRMFMTIMAVAIATDGARQTFALITRGGDILLGFLRSPPAVVLGFFAHGLSTDRRTGLASDDPGAAMRTQVVLAAVFFADEFAAVVAARHSFGLADVADHGGEW